MHLNGKDLALSATDLSKFLNCRHLTGLDMAAAHGALERQFFYDPLLELLIQRGEAHEKAYVDSLEAKGRKVVDLNATTDDQRIGRTIEAMHQGAEVIVQAAFQDGPWYGRADVIQRVEKPSALGGWSYEIWDTKLARETRAGTILQLSLYSDMLRLAQGVKPEWFYVVTPDPDSPITRYRVDDYAAYYRLVRAQLTSTIGQEYDAVRRANYPEPVEYCEVCAWIASCKQRRRADDHLSLVANISRLQRRELESKSITTLSQLAALPIPLKFRPKRGAVDSYVRVREQARLQFESRNKKPPPLYEFRPFKEGDGFCRLPAPAPGDVFLDLEGDPFARDGGREYLFGVATIGEDGAPTYQSFYGYTDHDERVAFESVVDFIMQRWKEHEGMHVYHYAPYEPSAFKRLCGRYVTREQELDRMLRAGIFVDLYRIVSQGVTAGIERYSIKDLEVFYSYTRDIKLDEADRCRRLMEQCLEANCHEKITDDIRQAVERYNRDDCVSTARLRDWLEKLRIDFEATGVAIPRPVADDGVAPPLVSEREKKTADLRARLLTDVTEDPAQRSQEQQARWVLAYLLDWHRREDKAAWRRYFELTELPEEELEDERDALAKLRFVERVDTIRNSRTQKPTGSVVDRYTYPPQECDIGRNDDLHLQSKKRFGSVVAVDRLKNTIDVRKGPTQAECHPTAVFSYKHVSIDTQESAIYAIGEAVAESGAIDGTDSGPFPLASRLLLRLPPILNGIEFKTRPEEGASDFALRLCGALDKSVLSIQGPPGSGKTFTGARMICELIKLGKKVGIAATGHTVIRNLLRAVRDTASDEGLTVSLAHKCDGDESNAEEDRIAVLADNESVLQALQTGAQNVIGGTSWVWSDPDLANSIDVLFVDEAGQISLANVVAMSGAANSIVLLGDPQQLDQPSKASHPEGVGVSVLEHVLGEHQTMPAELGIFLPETWRMAPSICAFTSEMFYEGRLSSKSGLERQIITDGRKFDGNGLWAIKLDHEGNRNWSLEEIDTVADLISHFLAGATWSNDAGTAFPIGPNDILVVAAYNAQVNRIAERVAATGVRVGTVDKFQGQQAPIVIYSTAASSADDAPRGLEFLLSANRLNVATSRARCAAILVTSRRLFESQCRSPRQMKLANALCRYQEMARTPV